MQLVEGMCTYPSEMTLTLQCGSAATGCEASKALQRGDLNYRRAEKSCGILSSSKTRLWFFKQTR